MEPEIQQYADNRAIAAQRPTSAIEEAVRYLSERIDLLHNRLDELGEVLRPYCKPEHKPEGGEVMPHDRDATSDHREMMDTLANRVQAASQRIDDLLARTEL